MDEEWAGIPPLPPLETVGEGVAANGARWRVVAGGTRLSCRTSLYITLPDGRQVGGGGMAGAALPAGRLINCSFHRSTDTRLCYVIGRVHPVVQRLRLDALRGSAPPVDLEPFGLAASLGVAFVAAILDEELLGSQITAWDARGKRVEEYSTAPYSAFFEGNEGRPEAGEAGYDGISGWDPA